MAEAATETRAAPAQVQPAPALAQQPAPTVAPPPVEPPRSSSFIVVRDRFTIYCDRPIPSLDMPNATAYEVTDRKQEGRPLYALVVKPEMPPRISAMRVLKGVEIAHLLQLVDWGVADWPPADRKCVIVIYHRPMGGRVMDSMSSANYKRIPDHLFAKNIIKPLSDTLVELATKGIAHRAIRPDNLYYMDEARTRIVIGDCVTSVPAHDQPVSVEPIESGMAMPAGRGAGNFHDDMYAFGATLLMLAVGRDTLQGVPNEEIVRRKIAIGSYGTLAGEERAPVVILECLRGLLADDPEQRWKAENIDLWLAGKRLTPIQAKAEGQARRAIRIGDQEFNSIRPLSYALYTNWEKASSIITDGSLEIWLRRQFEQNGMADAVALAIKNTNAMPGQKGEAQDILIARVLMILDPRAPIRMKSLCFNLDGYGPALAVAMLRKDTLTGYSDFINRELWRYYIAAQPKAGADHQQFEAVFKDLKNFLKDASMGAGLERCVYELNEWQFCMSPLISNQYVMEVKGVLGALDNAAKTANTKNWPIDRHVAAFLRARYAKGTSVQLDSMNDQRPERATIDMLSVLAIVQWRLGPEALYGLAGWVGSIMGPVINSYQNRDKRRELEKEIPKFVRKGNLAELYNYLDNPEERQKDAEGFNWAKTEFAAADKQIYDLEHGQGDRQEGAMKLGRQSGMIFAVIIMALTYVGCVLSKAM